MQATTQRQNFIDWMKAIGMFLIVAGHVIGDPNAVFNLVSQPAHTKQLGVAFFVFVAGWGLANVSHPSWHTVYKRTYLLLAYGLASALFFSAIFYYFKGTLQLSNYLPLFLGINVLFDNFPANSTTWYIGTYIHIVLLWFFVTRHLSVNTATLCIAFLIEFIVRTILISAGVSFIAYMLFTNWLTVFLLGHYLHNSADDSSLKNALLTGFCWVVVAVAWSLGLGMFTIEHSLPFNHLVMNSSLAVPLQSFFISTIYLLSTWLFFHFTRRLPSNAIVQFFSRNTILIFIIHLPIIFAFHPTYYQWLEGPLFDYRRISLILLVYLGSAVLSEVLTRLLRLERFRDRIWESLHKYAGASPPKKSL